MKLPRFAQLLPPLGLTPSLSSDQHYSDPYYSDPISSLAINPPMNSPTLDLYFAYGSNLWIEQMRERCPKSVLYGLGRLRGWHWIINDRQYANVVKITPNDPLPRNSVPEVWGTVWELTQENLAALDEFEGVSTGCYTRRKVVIDFWDKVDSSSMPIDRDGERGPLEGVPPYQIETWLYYDPWRTNSSIPHDEYISRMNSGLLDAISLGMPTSYVDRVIRPYIPEVKTDQDVKN
jgi:gamma-glutamylcyclotransferase (GGCT)/AIG2-like uncharacterized protein YtfP